MKKNIAVNFKFMIILLTMVSILSMGVQAEQCPQDNKDGIIKELRFINCNVTCTGLHVFNIQYDPDTQDFFYLGITYIRLYRELRRFIARSDRFGNNIWINELSHKIVTYPLMYSNLHKILYHTVYDNRRIVLASLNPIDGKYIEAFKIPLYLRYESRCELSNDSTSIFCSGVLDGKDSTFLFRFDTSSKQFHIAYSHSSRIFPFNVIALGNEIFFQALDDNTFHLIKLSVDLPNNSMNQSIHKSVNLNAHEHRFRSVVDDKSETIWHAISYGPKLAYFHLTLADFSIIGSKKFPKIYDKNSPFKNKILKHLGISEEVLVIFVNAEVSNLMIKVNAATHNVTNVYQIPGGQYDYRAFLVTNGYINLIRYPSTHHQIPVNQDYFDNNVDQDKFRNINSILTVEDFNLSLKSEKLSKYNLSLINTDNFDIGYENYTSYNLFVINGSFSTTIDVIYQLDPIYIKSNEIKDIAINLPFVLDENETVEYLIPSTLFPPYRVLDVSSSKIKMQGPKLYNDASYDTSLLLTYSNSSVIIKFTMFVQAKCTIDKCQVCDILGCVYCERFYKLHPMSRSCSFSDSYDFDFISGFPNFEFSAFKLSIGISIGLSLGARLIDGSPKRNDWAVIHMMQQLMLLPLLSKFTLNQAENMIVYSGVPTQTLNTISKKFLINNPLVQKLTFDQSHPYLKKLDCVSGSTIVNNLALVLILIVMGTLNLIVVILYHQTKNQNNCFHRSISKMYRFFTFSVYIRIFYETFLLLALMSIYEIQNYKESIREGVKIHRKYISLIFAYVILSFISLFLCLTFLSWLCNLNRHDVDEDSCLSREYYCGLRKASEQNRNVEESQLSQTVEDTENRVRISDDHSTVPLKVKIARLYPFLFLLKRLYLVLVIVLVSDTFFKEMIYSLIALQVIHIIYSYTIRHLYSKKDQYIDITNEMIYLILIIKLSKLTNYDKWDKAETFIFVYIILAYSWFLDALSAVTFIKILKNLLYTEVNIEEVDSYEERSYNSENNFIASSFDESRNREESKIN